MESRLYWEDSHAGDAMHLYDQETGFNLGSLKLAEGKWTFTHLGRVFVEHSDKGTAKNIAESTMLGLLTRLRGFDA